MSLRCLVVVCLVLAAEAAIIKSRNIPVEVVYDSSNPVHYGNRNLDAKIQLSSDELLKLKLSDDIINAGNEEAIEAQISEVFNESEGAKAGADLTEKGSKDGPEVQPAAPPSIPEGQKNLEEKIQISTQEIAQGVKFLPNSAQEKEKPVGIGLKASPVQSPKSENNLVMLLKKAEEIAYSGINNLRNNAEQASQTIANVSNGEIWDKLNQTLDNFFKDQYRHVSLKDDTNNVNNNENNNQNNQGNEFWQSFVNNFQNTVNNFVGNAFQQNNGQKPSGSEDEQGQGGTDQQNGVQNFLTSFANGFSTIVNNINNLNNQNAPNGTTGDTGEGGNGGNIFNNVVSSIQQFFSGGNNQGNNPIQGINGNQSDTGVQPPNNQGFFQGAINQFQGVINNFRPPAQSAQSTQAPAVQGDEETAPSSTTQGSNIFGGINQAFQNVGNPLGGQGGSGSGSGSGGSNPFDPQNIGSQISNQIGQFAGGQGGQGGGGSGGSNPLNPQNIGSQISNQFGQFAGQGGQGGSNPIDPQAIGTQIGNQIGQFAGGQGGGSGGQGNLPIDPAAIGSQIGNQIGQFAGGQGGNSGSSTAASSTEATKKSENVEPLLAVKTEEKLEEKKPAASLKIES